MDEKYLVSVIVPVYKVEKYLPKCVDSILAQTYSNLEVILVDDGSPDRSGEMCDEYASQDVRVRVVHRKNGGLSAARNSGMDIATGDFIIFVDSDDWIEPETVAVCIDEILAEEAKGIKVDVLYFSFNDVPDGEILIKHKQYINPIYIGQVYTSNEFWEYYMDDTWSLHKSVWDKFFRSQSINSLRFREGIKGEDSIFMIEFHISNHDLTTKITDHALYNYRTAREGSIINLAIKDAWEDSFSMYLNLFSSLSNNSRYKTYISTHAFSTFVAIYTHAKINKLSLYQGYDDFFKKWLPIIRKMPLNKSARTYRRLRFFQLSPWLYNIIMHLKKRK